jgi:hypothetical protein
LIQKCDFLVSSSIFAFPKWGLLVCRYVWVTMEALEPIIEKIKGMTVEEASTFRIPEGTLTPIHLRAIERLYGIGTDHGQDIRRMILDYPAATAHVVMARLKQKDIEWRKVKVEVTPIWVDVYEKNYNKSLDHRSFYFKQTDKKALSAKGMMGEIKEVSDKKKTSEDAIGCGASGAAGAHGVSPDLTFTYADRKVHDDVYAVLKFSTHEMMNAEQAERVMKTWREFVEPFFGIHRADTEGDYVDDSAEQAAVFVRKDDEEEENGDGDGDDDEAGDKTNGGAVQGECSCDPSLEESARFQPKSRYSENPVFQSLLFQMRLVPLHAGVGKADGGSDNDVDAMAMPSGKVGAGGDGGAAASRGEDGEDVDMAGDDDSAEKGNDEVGLYALNPVDPERLNAPGFNP